MKERDKKLIALGLMLVLGFTIGVIYAGTKAVKWTIGLGLHFLKLQGYEVAPDMEEIMYNVDSYKYHISRCYPNISLKGGIE